MTTQSPDNTPLTISERQLVQTWMLKLIPDDGSVIDSEWLKEKLTKKAESQFSLSDEEYRAIRSELVTQGVLQTSRRDSLVSRVTSPALVNDQESGNVVTHSDLVEPVSDSPESLEKLRSRLLDLSARNRLLNFSHARSKRCAQIIDELPNNLFETLITEQLMRFAPVPEPTERQLIERGYLKYDERTGAVVEVKKPPTAETWAQLLGMSTSYELPIETGVSEGKHSDDIIQTLYFPAELESRLQILHAQSRMSLEETGANILYLALGFLEWNELSAGKTSTRLAPLMLLPVRLEKGKLNQKTATFDYEILYTGEDILTNLSLREKLRRDFSIALPLITEDVLPETYFDRVRETVLDIKPDWKLHRFASLGLFEFGKLMMYLDLEPGKNPNLIQSNLVQRLLGLANQKKASADNSFSLEYAIDELPDVHHQYPLIDDADSSQHSALVDAMRGEDLVIEGPPGTGKSQTITNMISAAMAQGKKVLFVAEKRAALEVVKNRLTRAGLGEFCLELHSHKSQKSAVAASIGQRISSQGSYRKPNQLKALIDNYERLKSQLNDHVQALHLLQGDTGLTAHQILMQATRLRENLALRPADFHPENAANLDKNQVYEQAGYFAHIYTRTGAEAGQAGRFETHPWFGCEKTQLSGLERTQLLQRLQDAIAALQTLDSSRTRAADLINIKELEALSPEALQALANALATLPLPKGDEDWNLITRLDASSCSAMQTWLTNMDVLTDRQIALAQALNPTVINSSNTLARMHKAIGQIRQHSDSDQLELDTLLTLIQQARELTPRAASVHALIQTINKLEAIPALKTDKKGAEQLSLLLDLLQMMPIALAGMRDKRFDEVSLDTVIPEIDARLKSIKLLEDESARVFKLDQLPDHAQLEDLERVLADRSLFRWFKSSWRSAKAKVLSMARPGITLKIALSVLPAAAQYQRDLGQLNGNKVYREALSEHFQGLQTQTDILRTVRDWYRVLREKCGRGFGGDVWIAEYLLKENVLVIEQLASNAQALKEYLNDVLTLRREFETLLPFDKHPLQSDDLLANDGFYLRLIGHVGEALNDLLPLIREQRPTIGRVRELAQAVEEWQENAATQQSNVALITCLEGEQLPRFDNLVEERARLIAWSHSVSLVHSLMELSTRHLLIEQLTACAANQIEPLIRQWHIQGQQLLDVSQAWNRALNDFISTAEIEPAQWWKTTDLSDFAAIDQRLKWASHNEDLIDHWLEYRRLRKRLADLGFESVIVAVENQTLPSERTQDACLLGLTDAWARQILENNPALGQFSGKDQEAIRARFAEIDNQLTKLQREQLAAQIDQHHVPEGNNSGKVKERTQLALLKHEAGKKMRHEPIRELMHRAAEALQGLKPCFMMSPMAVAQYLPAGKLHFDIVVMDEASQVRPEEALGAISRGSQLIVVGDPKQLPPTSFFTRQGGDDDEDNEELSVAEDSESILEAAMPLFKLRRLRWHYRSRHESLIAFSNKEFYDSNLVVYPSPHSESTEFGVKFSKVARGRFVDQRNKEEAEIVAKAIEHHLINRPEESLGVVAMNIKQADQIERALEHLAKQNPTFQEARNRNETANEPLFIKNLENVQGDERDVIYISTTYGPLEIGGTVPQRFGPITGADGWRRLNVLFTRAKKRMQVFASFSASDLLITGTSSRGVKALRDFLQFAESGRMALTRESDRMPDSDFEVAVIAALERHGYQCEPQVGVAGFYIDLAVRDPGQPGRYIMGIECDGAAYHSAKSARDRDRLRQNVLEQLGWNIRRIWSVDWFRNARLQLEPILQELATLRTEPVTDIAAEHTEEDLIRETVEEQSQQAERLNLAADASLRDRLIALEQKIIRIALPETPDQRRLLRPAMLEALLEFRPEDRSEFQQRIPGYLRDGTDPAEGRFIDDVLSVISDFG